jgi:hypothetical protein
MRLITLPKKYVAVQLDAQIADELYAVAKELKVKDGSVVANWVLARSNIRRIAKEALCHKKCFKQVMAKAMKLGTSPAQASENYDSCVKRCIGEFAPP